MIGLTFRDWLVLEVCETVNFFARHEVAQYDPLQQTFFIVKIAFFVLEAVLVVLLRFFNHCS